MLTRPMMHIAGLKNSVGLFLYHSTEPSVKNPIHDSMMGIGISTWNSTGIGISMWDLMRVTITGEFDG